MTTQQLVSDSRKPLTRFGLEITNYCFTGEPEATRKRAPRGGASSRTSDKGGGATLVRLCLARVFLVRCCASWRLQLQRANMRRQIAPNLLSGGQQALDSAGATLDLLAQHLASRRRAHLSQRRDFRKPRTEDFFRFFFPLIGSDSLPASRLQLRPTGRRAHRGRWRIEHGRRNRRRALVDRPSLIPGPQETLGIPATRQAPHAGTTPAVMSQRSAPALQQLLTVALLLVAGGQDSARKIRS